MNFLAHAFLSGSNDQLLIGNFIADAIKGDHIDQYREDIRKGITLHRSIDSYTDHHPLFIQSKNRIRSEYGKFSAVIIDIYYDHFLALNWSDYSEDDLSEYVLHVYKLMLRNYEILPPRSKRVLPYMIIHNWLLGYSRFNDLQWVFNGMSRRAKRYKSGMENAVHSLKKNYDPFKEDFKQFFPDMISYATSVRQTL
ncbi:MAG: DUF479 domain-containing protein [Bacteroidetes bacterium]|nr:DUF479 domain-containing protein [Bacteroidota bacterium]